MHQPSEAKKKRSPLPKADAPLSAAAAREQFAEVLRELLPGALAEGGAKVSAAHIERTIHLLSIRLARKRRLLASIEKRSMSRTKREARAKAAQASRWVTTQEAADLTGFSRPFVARLLDSGNYPGEVHRTLKGGHRKVRGDEFQNWIKQISVGTDPGTLQQVRATADVELREGEGQTDPSAAEQEARAASRARALELSKKLGRF